jgi:hypothetical protein
MKDGLDDPRAGNPTAGELKAAAITIVVPSDKWVDQGFVNDMSKFGVNVYISHTFINKQTGRVVFSSPRKLNFINESNRPYTVKGDINGIAPNVQKAAERWRIDMKKELDDGDN